MSNTYHYTEDSLEQTIIELFTAMGYDYHYGPELEEQTGRDLSDPCIPGELSAALRRLNPQAEPAALAEAERQVKALFHEPLLQANIQMTDWLQNGLDVNYRAANGQIKADHIKIINYPLGPKGRLPEQELSILNSYTVVNQWSVLNGQALKRADVVVFVNGLPLSVIELKSPSREETNWEEAHQQLQNYMWQVPQLFTACQVCVISDMAVTKVGSITAPIDRFMEWKTVDGSEESRAIADFETPFNGIFHKSRFLDIVGHFTLTMGSEKRFRILAGYHQYYAVKRAMDCTLQALERKDGKIGVFWHTQGSGKSLSMVFYAHQLLTHLPSATILVLTDRLDLNDQLYQTFCDCRDYLRQTPEKAEDGDHLHELLEKRRSHGIIFTNIHKFKDRSEPITRRTDIIVLSDEAHRSQANDKERWDEKTQELKKGFAKRIRELLPGASFIGFTGTPIEQTDHDTKDVFGDYIDIYDMTQAVEDGATVPVFYESRLIKLNLDGETLSMLDNEYDRLADEGAEDEDIERSKRENSRLHALLRAPETVDCLCRDIIQHYEDNRAHHLTGKAMIVAIDRPTGIAIYRKLMELRPEWKDIVGVVMTQGNQDPVEWNEIIGPPARKKQLAVEFKKNDSPMKIAIVVDMWLTGFDVPSLATMYVYKPMKGHNLMQAIARVNRVFPEKSGGLVVDYIGIASALKKAMHDYTKRDQRRFGNQDIKTTAYDEFCNLLDHCKAALNFDITAFATCSNLERANLIRRGVNVLLNPQTEDAKEAFLKESKSLAQITTICRSLLTPAEKYDEAYIEAVRTLLVRLSATKKISKKIIDERISSLLNVAVKADGVVEVLNTKGEEFSLFDENFLAEMAAMNEKNLAAELLKRLLQEHIQKHRRKKMVEAERFSQMLDAKLAEYLRGLLSNEEVIRELIKMAQMLVAQSKEASALGLTEEEQAFYDALTKPQAVRDFYENAVLVAMSKELTEMLRRSKTLDWRLKESARANMRRMVKRLLRKYKYPPEEEQNALETVIRQCELWVEEEYDPMVNNINVNVTVHNEIHVTGNEHVDINPNLQTINYKQQN